MGSYINGSTDSTGNRGADGSRFQPPEISTATIWAFTQPGMLMLCVIVAGMSTVGINMVSTIIALKTVMQEQHITTQPPTRSLESGYRYTMDFASNQSLSLIPQLQVVWQSYKRTACKHTIRVLTVKIAKTGPLASVFASRVRHRQPMRFFSHSPKSTGYI
jgi:type V secretory pathway adhesin AidA